MNLIYHHNQVVKGNVFLDGSKSLSNRLLLINSLCNNTIKISNLSTSDDTLAMQKAFTQPNNTEINVGAAGTAMRFLTAYFASTPNSYVTLTGSERMKKRPIAALVNALKKLGADINYLEKNEFPPLKIKGKQLTGGEIEIPADISSQYLSALAMIAPLFSKGLTMHLLGNPVSQSYLKMTLNVMEYFNVKSSFNYPTLNILPQKYTPKPYTIEADWSAASYYYAIAAFSQQCTINLHGLFKNSPQGDSQIAQYMQQFGINTTYHPTHITISKNAPITPKLIEINCINCPDIAQTLIVICAGLGVNANFLGLQTLAIKETDRTAALAQELLKIGAKFEPINNTWQLIAPTKLNKKLSPSFLTYDDHRMAMAFAPLAMLFNTIQIKNPEVVSKSYPNFWKDLQTFGFN